MRVRSSALRFWGVVLGVTVGVAAFGLATVDLGPSRWAGAIMLIVVVIVGAGQPVRLLGIPLGLVFAGLYSAAASALGSVDVTPTFVVCALLLALLVAIVAEMFGRVCTAEDERRLSTAVAVENLTPTDPLAGVMKWQHAAPLFEREIDRARRLDQQLSFLLVRIDGGEDLDRRFGPDGAAQALGAVGGRLQRLCRSTDIVLYRGLGHFGVVLPDTSPELTDVVARRIVEASDIVPPVALLVGAATFPRDGQDPSDLMRVAARRASDQQTQHDLTGDHPGQPRSDIAEATQ
jgi:diguanylate cyclase (GGDEF)-like protein